MKELLKKLAAAKAEIKATKLKKEGKNTFSNYEYFTPSQIEFLVATACHNNKLLTSFDLIRNDLGVYGRLTIYDLESGEKMTAEMASAIPEIKATNVAQQLGGCMTYTERYLKTSAFGITDNRLDFDTTENTKGAAEAIKKAETTPVKKVEPTNKPIDKVGIAKNYLNTDDNARNYYLTRYKIEELIAFSDGQLAEIYESLKSFGKV
ncbi:MAG: hypothetical protein EOM76_09315 [Sphingobacteriia bacterium]|nr:hypothetical protein [Sphingobacteriia bacterium]